MNLREAQRALAHKIGLELLELERSGLTQGQIAERYGRSQSWVSSRLVRVREPLLTRVKYAAPKLKKRDLQRAALAEAAAVFLALEAQGLTHAQIAEQHAITAIRVSQILRRVRPSRAHRPRWNSEKKAKLPRHWMAGLSLRAIARELDVSFSTVTRVADGLGLPPRVYVPQQAL